MYCKRRNKCVLGENLDDLVGEEGSEIEALAHILEELGFEISEVGIVDLKASIEVDSGNDSGNDGNNSGNNNNYNCLICNIL